MRKSIVILGPTASGKTSLSIQISNLLNLPIYNFDTRQFWKNIKILTASPSNHEISMAKHCLFNELKNNESPTLGKWSEMLSNSLHDQKLLVGGSGFYIRGLQKGIPIYSSIKHKNVQGNWEELNKLSPIMAKNINMYDTRRINRALWFYKNFQCTFQEYPYKYQEKLFVIWIERDDINKRIAQRSKLMIHEAINEVKGIISSGKDYKNFLSVIGFKEILNYLNKESTLNETLELLITKTKQYAKKQIKFKKQIKIDLVLKNGILSKNHIMLLKNFLIS